MVTISNRLIDYKMVWFKTDDKSGNLSKIILQECEKEAKKLKEEIKKESNKDSIIVYDYKKAGFGINIMLYAYEK